MEGGTVQVFHGLVHRLCRLPLIQVPRVATQPGSPPNTFHRLLHDRITGRFRIPQEVINP
jgi:hypothetical protein